MCHKKCLPDSCVCVSLLIHAASQLFLYPSAITAWCMTTPHAYTHPNIDVYKHLYLFQQNAWFTQVKNWCSFALVGDGEHPNVKHWKNACIVVTERSAWSIICMANPPSTPSHTAHIHSACCLYEPHCGRALRCSLTRGCGLHAEAPHPPSAHLEKILKHCMLICR